MKLNLLRFMKAFVGLEGPEQREMLSTHGRGGAGALTAVMPWLAVSLWLRQPSPAAEHPCRAGLAGTCPLHIRVRSLHRESRWMPLPRDVEPPENCCWENKSVFDSYRRTWERQGAASQAEMPFGTVLGGSQAWLTAECTLRAVPAQRLSLALKESTEPGGWGSAAYHENETPRDSLLQNKH